MSALFLGFVALVVTLAGAIVVRFAPVEIRVKTLTGLSAWVSYATALGYLGTRLFPAGASRLPMLLAVPAVGLVVFCARSHFAGQLARTIPPYALIGLESFRIGVELFLHQLWVLGLVPKMLTYDGANFDLLIGLSAPIVAWLLSTKRLAPRVAIAWNLLGIAMLANVVVRSVLTTPGPTHLLITDVANRAVTHFPYTFIPGLLAPIAVLLHLLAIRGLRSTQSPLVVVHHPPANLMPVTENP
jgi:hypothetical protein